MNIDELIDELCKFMTEDEYTELDKVIFKTVTMLRKQKTLSITDDEAMNLWNEASSHPVDFARAILRKAQEK